MEGLIYRNLYDEDGAIVSNDGKILYKVPDIAHYRIKEGVEEIDKHAFKNCPHLKEVDIPYTVQWYMDEPMSNYWKWPYPENCIRSDELEAEIAEGWVDEFGAVYSKDRKRLLVCADVKNYKILEGTEKVERLAFIGCNKLQCLYFPYTLPEENFDAILGGTDTVGAICFWDRPYVPEELAPNESWVDDEVFIDEHDVVYTKDRKRLLYARIGLKKAYYEVPDGTLTICDQAFLFHVGYLVLSLPASIKVIGDDIFGKDGGKIIIRDEL